MGVIPQAVPEVNPQQGTLETDLLRLSSMNSYGNC